ncbi:DUF1499 domain-containing protein [Acidiphilium acidophilum]|uniref:DUF1499 domain-containing protein n=1 Tax=Acidiphilium acidophilum TaxID=76588 RepID=A0AAW9DP53_ACIAO|nr:DUF1499 domain-containing protein [Acidiphilium acidophilum]MDX5930407.1 DUF1499 domain-containing protein [Acidiphilium acidophilum]
MSVGVLPLLLSLVFPACGKPGAQGVTPPGVVDFDHLVLPKTPNKALAAPAGFSPPPTVITPHYRVSQGKLFGIVGEVAASEPRTYKLDAYPARFQAAFVARSKAANFPDIIEVAVRPAPSGGSELILYSHSIYGQSDFGVNAARVKAWLSAIEARVVKDQSAAQ